MRFLSSSTRSPRRAINATAVAEPARASAVASPIPLLAPVDERDGAIEMLVHVHMVRIKSLIRTSVRYTGGVGWHTGPPSWTEMERVLNGKPRRAGWPIDEQAGDGGDSPAWSRKRGSYRAARCRGVPSRRCRTPSCTRIRRTASSTAPARRRNSSRRPPGSICGPSR